jgi:hypothetical protein
VHIKRVYVTGPEQGGIDNGAMMPTFSTWLVTRENSENSKGFHRACACGRALSHLKTSADKRRSRSNDKPFASLLRCRNRLLQCFLNLPAVINGASADYTGTKLTPLIPTKSTGLVHEHWQQVQLLTLVYIDRVVRTVVVWHRMVHSHWRTMSGW